MWRQIFGEFMGTFVFLSIIMSVTSNTNEFGLAAVYIGLGLATSILFVSKISDVCAFNPAVTLALALRHNIDWSEAIALILTQLLAGVVAYLWWHSTLDTAPFLPLFRA